MTATRAHPIVLDEDFIDDPHPLLRRLREEDPLAWVTIPYGSRGVLVTRDADARAAMTAPEVSKDVRPALAITTRAPSTASLSAHLLNSDNDDHHRLRACLGAAVRIDDAENWWSQIIWKAAGEETDAFLRGRGHGDLREWADRVPSAVISAVLGISRAETSALVAACGPLAAQQSRQDVAAATVQVQERIASLLSQTRARRPTAAVASLAAAHAAGTIDHQELMASVFVALFAGFETAAAFLGSAMERLLASRRTWTELPDTLDQVISELLRLEPPLAMATVRLSRQPLQLPSGPVRAGTLIFVSLAAANRDPRRYQDPDELLPGRPAHLSFGFGDHYCLGHRVARLEVAAALTCLRDRAPRLRPVSPTPPRHRRSVFIRTPESLPARWD